MEFVKEYSDLLKNIPVFSEGTLTSILLSNDEHENKMIIATYKTLPGGVFLAFKENFEDDEEVETGFEFFDDLQHKSKKEECVLAADEEEQIENVGEPRGSFSIDKLEEKFGEFYKAFPVDFKDWRVNLLEFHTEGALKLCQVSYLDSDLNEFTAYLIQAGEAGFQGFLNKNERLDEDSLIELKENLYFTSFGDLEDSDEFLRKVKSEL